MAAAGKGEAFLAEGEKALNRTTIFGFGKNQKFEDAADAFTKAGNAFKISKEWQKAGEAFIRASVSYSKTDSPNDAVNSFVEAGNCFKNVTIPVEIASSRAEAK